MAHLWVRDDKNEWAVLELRGPRTRLSPFGTFSESSNLALVESDGKWTLIGSADSRLRVNGDLVATGIRVLSDRDEIRDAGRAQYFFSTEQLAQVVPFPGADREVICPRCQLPITKGQDAVKCTGGCANWLHQTEERKCYTYGPCPIDQSETELGDDAEFRWSPEQLGA